MKVTLSSFLSWSKSDFVKAFFMVVGGAVLGLLVTWVNQGIFTFDFTEIWHTAYKAAVVYLGVKFFTPTPSSVVVDTTKTDVIDKNTNKKVA